MTGSGVVFSGWKYHQAEFLQILKSRPLVSSQCFCACVLGRIAWWKVPELVFDLQFRHVWQIRECWGFLWVQIKRENKESYRNAICLFGSDPKGQSFFCCYVCFHCCLSLSSKSKDLRTVTQISCLLLFTLAWLSLDDFRCVKKLQSLFCAPRQV